MTGELKPWPGSAPGDRAQAVRRPADARPGQIRGAQLPHPNVATVHDLGEPFQR